MLLIKKPELTRYLKGYNLDYVNFNILDIRPQNEHCAAILMHDTRPSNPEPWCVQYGGGGHYFPTYEEMAAYCELRGWCSAGPLHQRATPGKSRLATNKMIGETQV